MEANNEKEGIIGIRKVKEKYEIKANSMALFVKVGVIVLSILMIIGFGIKVFPGAITVSRISSRRDLPIHSVETAEKKIALSFDVSGDNEDMAEILEILSENYVKASFFVTGKWVEDYPEDVKAIAKAGHDVANHSEHHIQMTELSTQECEAEIMTVHRRVKELTGIDMNLFRIPYGDYTDKIVGTARECGYYTIQWDVDVYATTLKLENTRG